ncbi:hypothetical protein AHIS1636_40200 [Arthrobacter mangrovi]|uniref:Uncharacterized protein n=1 Tax=Arthrobacter mangrovi TaxID=2966350 RepID=A0ABQ5N062_9MICC|nr:hypothetical protein AHIS1636_40200 [Arthrobacter mangrovi]
MLGRGERLTGQHGLIKLKTVTVEEPEIGRDAFTAFQQYDISRHDVASGHHLLEAVPEGPAGRGGKRLQGPDIGLRLALLNKSQSCVDCQNEKDCPGVHPVLLEESHYGCNHQNPDQGADELTQQDPPPRGGPGEAQLIRAGILQPAGRLGSAESPRSR